MKTNNLFSSLIGLLIVLVFNSCQKDDNDISYNFPTTPEEIAEAVENTEHLIVNADLIIEKAISNAYSSDDLIDIDEIVEQIKSIKGVEAVEATSTGTGIVVKQIDGTYTNLFVVTEDDERLFIESSTRSSPLSTLSTLLVHEKPVLPNGNGKALILAPFQSDFNTDLDQISILLESAGYDVDSYTDNNATLSKFRGSFLNDFDIIFIRTHGAANYKTRGGDISTVLLTGEKYTEKLIESLTEDEQKAIAIGGHDGEGYVAISTQWLNLTTDANFTNSWVYAGGCETAMIDEGSSSLSEAFLNLKAIGYNGFDASITTSISNPIAEKMVASFTSGLSFTDASEKVLNDWGLKAKAWALRLVSSSDIDDAIRVELFDYNKNISDPFYLIDPDEVVGVGVIIPEAGPVGTEVVYKVVINDKFVSQVASIEFDIDNTGEHIIMPRISNNTWQRDRLFAPYAESYPRIDTFTFSAFDENGNLIGQGSATFSILEEASTKSTSIKNTKYYAK